MERRRCRWRGSGVGGEDQVEVERRRWRWRGSGVGGEEEVVGEEH